MGFTMGQQIADDAPVVAIFNVAMIGHVNPTFALVQELVKRGSRVHYFLPPVSQIRDAAEEAGAIVEPYMEGDPSDFALEKCGLADGADVPPEERQMWERNVWPLASTLLAGSYVISRCRELDVRVVLYDPTTPHGLLVSEVLGVPCASLVTYPGFGSLSDMMNSMAREGRLERSIEIRRPYGQRIRDRFGVDVQEWLLSRRQYFTVTNYITTCEDLVAPLPAAGEQAWADELGRFNFIPVGCMVSHDAPHVTTARSVAIPHSKSFGHELPSAGLSQMAAEGTKVIFAALGTMALSDRWNQDLGRVSGGNLPAGTTGKQFCQHVWASLIEACQVLGDGYACVMCVGKQPDALDFLGGEQDEVLAKLPSNVITRTSLPQVDMLDNFTSIFISHVGFNSLQESLMAGVPLLAMPQAVDQPANARKVEASGWGHSFLNPMETVTPQSLVTAIQEVCASDSPYHQAVRAAKEQLQGGAQRVADLLLDCANQAAIQ